MDLRVNRDHQVRMVRQDQLVLQEVPAGLVDQED
jgi:hypothetical protein